MESEFSALADVYKTFRPAYPRSVIDTILEADTGIRSCSTAWDAAAGSFQITDKIAPFYQHVYANDISHAQLTINPAQPNVHIIEAPCEHIPQIPDNSVSLVVCGQAIHWFDPIDAFYAEAVRVAKQDAGIVVLGYGRPHALDERLDSIIGGHYAEMRASGFRDQKLENLA